MASLDLIVTAVHAETPLIRRIRLASNTVDPLPNYPAGAHLTVTVPEVGPRKYSLVRTTPEAAHAHPSDYTLGIRLDAAGGGGSRWMHALAVGDHVIAEAPKNDFPLKPGAVPVALIGGGIGITPLVSMAAELKAARRPFRLAYAARARAELAFLPEIESLSDGQQTVQIDAETGRFFDVEAYFRTLASDTMIYMCGPKPMLKAGMDACRALGWPRDRLSFELFYSAVAATAPVPPPPLAAPAPIARIAKQSDLGAEGFDIVIKSSGATHHVPPDKSILSVLIDAGLDPIHDCQKGECGVCQVSVLDGVPDHRDTVLSDSDRASNKVMQICISRSKSARLVLDL
jgi:ferredoxin-NADP reductase